MTESNAEAWTMLAVGAGILTWPIWGKLAAYGICLAAGADVGPFSWRMILP